MKTAQIAFGGGEISSALFGRVDLQKYQTGVEFAENFILRAEGGLAKRPGLYLVAEPKFGTTKDVELVEWRISANDSYLLEIGDFYIRFIRFGGQLTSGGVPVEVVTPYPHTVARTLKFAFANDVAKIFHNNYAPRELRRTGVNTFTLTTVPTQNDLGTPVITAIDWLGQGQTETYVPVPRQMDYCVSLIYDDGRETLPSTVVSVSSDLGHHALSNRVTFYNPTPPAGVTPLRNAIYKSKNGIFGFVGYVPYEPGPVVWYDRNIDPTFDTVPVRQFLGFSNSPGVGEFYKQRLAVGCSENHPQKLWFSKIGLFNDFSDSFPIQADDGFSFSLDGGGTHTILHMVALRKLVIFTTSAEWIMEQEGEGFSVKTANPVPTSYYGSVGHLRPLKIKERILFVDALSSSVRDFGYDIQADGFVADDLTRLSRHLFKDAAIRSWTHAAFPYELVLAVTEDGRLPHMTYLREDEVWGWTHSRTQGRFLTAGSVSEVRENGAYFLVDRVINGQLRRFIERFKFTYDKDIRDAFYVDCGLSYDEPLGATFQGFANNTITATVPGHNYVVGTQVELSWQGEYNEEQKEAPYYVVQTKVTSLAPLSFVPKHPLPAGIEFPIAFNTTMIAREMTTRLTGLGHLNGASVVALADGNVLHDLTVAGGQLALPYAAARVHVGLPYDARIRTLDLDANQETGQGNIKAIPSVTLKIEKSRGLLVGSKGKELFELPSREDERYDEPNRVLTGLYTVSVASDWSRAAGVEISCPDPLPATIQSIVPDIEYSG